MLRRVVQAYLAAGETAETLLADARLDWRDDERMRFVVENVVEALAPSNSLLSPLVWKTLIDTGGLSAAAGLTNLVKDLATSPRVPSMVEPDAFELGRTIAATPGAVVLRTPVFELIQYTPQTPKVRATPLLIVPPVINKYYIVDLSPGRSMVDYFVKQGQQVFVISWRNPDARHRSWTTPGPARPRPSQMSVRPHSPSRHLGGRATSTAAPWPRCSPGLSNALTVPGGTTMLGTAVDLGKVTVDSHIVAGIADHICRWQACYSSTQLLGGPCRFILSTSGHIASIVNPPDSSKATFQVNVANPPDSAEWLRSATRSPGSWWPDYADWLGQRSGPMKKAPAELGGAGLDPMEPAPGTFQRPDHGQTPPKRHPARVHRWAHRTGHQGLRVRPGDLSVPGQGAIMTVDPTDF